MILSGGLHLVDKSPQTPLGMGRNSSGNVFVLEEARGYNLFDHFQNIQKRQWSYVVHICFMTTSVL